ncbi:hypothetical protein PanWU01x14_368350 [Parasponia andersonii]|uniref:Uncharacterized protein n=1 Tax=Parasponia andersonii TaxID=3476 RepID=A0A2P5A506_PARAD|nr:hypothetical protein PanWU01x14_368350 [Parasponia andersonii]
MNFNLGAFWIQILNVLVACMTEDCARFRHSQMGVVENVEVYEETLRASTPSNHSRTEYERYDNKTRAPKRNIPASSMANFDIEDGDSGPNKDCNPYFDEIRELEEDMEVYGVNSVEELVKMKDSEQASGKDLPPVIVPREGTHLTDEETESIIRRAEIILHLVKEKKGKVDTGVNS